MALGFGNKKTSNNLSPESSNEKPNYGEYAGNPNVAEMGGAEPRARKGSRIDAPITKGIAGDAEQDSDTDTSVSIGKQMELEAGNAIQYRTCSWKKTAALLFSEYICLAIMSFPYSYSVLGLVPGLILTVVVAGLVLYTSLTVW
jgi:hypothetical protein